MKIYRILVDGEDDLLTICEECEIEIDGDTIEVRPAEPGDICDNCGWDFDES